MHVYIIQRHQLTYGIVITTVKQSFFLVLEIAILFYFFNFRLNIYQWILPYIISNEEWLQV